MIIPIYISDRASRNYGKKSGEYDTETKIYKEMISYAAGHLFKHPKYFGKFFKSRCVIDRLKELNCRYMRFLIADYPHEKSSFYITIELDKFIEHAVIEDFDGVQLGCDIRHWTKTYLDQAVLGAI